MPPRTPYLLLLLLAACLLGVGCRDARATDHGKEATKLRRTIERATGHELCGLLLPDESDLDRIPQDPRNRLSAEKVALGRALFHEAGLTRLSGDDFAASVSCASCHDAAAGFQSGSVQGVARHADRLDAQGIRTPSVLGVAYQDVLHWNGQLGAGGANAGTDAQWTSGTPKAVNFYGYAGPEAQAIAGLDIHGFEVTPARLDSLGYSVAFRTVFGTLPQNPDDARRDAGLAIAAYERTLLPTRAPFQRWLSGERDAMLKEQLRGATVFFGKGGCATCHAGPTLSDGSFHTLGLPDLHEAPETTYGASADMGVNLGRASFTHHSDDLYAFKTPQLYNLADNPYYGHGSSHRSIEAIVRHHLEGQSRNQRVRSEQLDPALANARLSEREIADLVTFLRDGLRDPDLVRYVPASGERRKPDPLALGR